MKLILLRHGQSQWNLENRFTGWKDVNLTDQGIQEAKFAANQINQEGINISSIYTSKLLRAIRTAKIVCNEINFPLESIHYDWRLNERHYGALQGLNKSETAAKYGEEQVLIWRRSFDIPPPLLKEDDERHPKFDKVFKEIDRSDLPSGESLNNVIKRLEPFWNTYKNFLKQNHGNHLIVAHSNSLRAIVKILDKLTEKEIMKVNIPTGVPLVYDLNNDINVINKKYLINDEELKIKQDLVAKQGKVQ
ncbi:MAG: 2,3-diphosphoglycerate-dependent phosphoglycerate mutase [Candidatus Neomarinimicrobiota bacterium]|nr:2,3-diphosphoglycerate-dependent phosphoglycerate mutase [Candidatus Neomarinimicrobiota bacterium]